MNDDEEDAGARFDAVMELFRQAWSTAFPSERFEIDGCVTPNAMAFIAGYEAGRSALVKEEEL